MRSNSQSELTSRWSRDAETLARRRHTFDEVAADYDRVRPPYPTEVFDELVDLAGLSPGSRVLEVGCGTGQASVPLARRDLSIVAIEPGKELAARARQRLAAFSAVEVVTAGFEEWQAPDEAFDAVVSFAAIHWVDPDIRYPKTAQLLNPDGAIAVFDWTDTLAHDGDDFFREVVTDYAAVVPEWQVAAPPAPPEIASSAKDDIAASGRFGPVEERRFVWPATYRAGDYIAFLTTRSSYRVLEPARRQQLFDRIQRRIEGRPSQVVTPEFLGILAVARRLREGDEV
jgi:SAM-dependent methyltransferase